MGMIKKVTAKAPTLGTVQVDNKEWVKVDAAKMEAVKVGDNLEAPHAEEKAKATPPVKAIEAKKEDTKRKDAPVDWAAKDRSQLVGGRSHDAAELVKASVSSGIPLDEVLKLYEDALKAILKIADDIK